MIIRSTLVVALGLGGVLLLDRPARAQSDSECLQDLAAAESAHLGIVEHMSSFELRSLATLRNAAQVLTRNDKEDACEELVQAIGEILEDRRDELVDAGLMVEAGDQDRMTQLESAARVQDLVQPLRAGNVIGASLRNTQDEYLGEISDVVFDPEGREMTHALVEVGGFLGLGEEIVAVPLSTLRVTDNMSTFVLAMSPERFAEAPRLGSEQMAQVDDLEWREKNDLYYTIAQN